MEPKCLWLSVLLLLLEGCRWFSTDACLEHERIALLKLKPFFNRHNVLNSWVEEVKGSDCCQWDRVECNTSSSSRRVIGLYLNFTGRPNHQIWYLNASVFLSFNELKRLYLRGNGIAGYVENEGPFCLFIFNYSTAIYIMEIHSSLFHFYNFIFNSILFH